MVGVNYILVHPPPARGVERGGPLLAVPHSIEFHASVIDRLGRARRSAMVVGTRCRAVLFGEDIVLFDEGTIAGGASVAGSDISRSSGTDFRLCRAAHGGWS